MLPDEIPGEYISPILQKPLGFVELDEGVEGLADLLRGADALPRNSLFLLGYFAAFSYPMGLGLGNEGSARHHAPKVDLVEDMISGYGCHDPYAAPTPGWRPG